MVTAVVLHSAAPGQSVTAQLAGVVGLLASPSPHLLNAAAHLEQPAVPQDISIKAVKAERGHGQGKGGSDSSSGGRKKSSRGDLLGSLTAT